MLQLDISDMMVGIFCYQELIVSHYVIHFVFSFHLSATVKDNDESKGLQDIVTVFCIGVVTFILNNSLSCILCLCLILQKSLTAYT